MLNKKLKTLGLLVFVSVLSVTWADAQRGSDASKTFKVKKGGTLVIEADNVYADIEIRVWNKSEVRVEVEGIPEDDLDDLEMSELSQGGKSYNLFHSLVGDWRILNCQYL